MKRFFAILLACSLLIGTTSAFSDGIDLSTMTLEELQSLSNAINAEIDTRFGKSLGYIGTGVYVVGKDIKAGTYNLIDIKIPVSETKGWFYIYSSVEDHENHDCFTYYALRNGETATLSLSEGMVISISGFTAQVEECTASWMIGQ